MSDNEEHFTDDEFAEKMMAFAEALADAAREQGEMLDGGDGVTVYLAGPMRGVPYFNVQAFDEAEALLSAQGFTVFNPAQRDRAEGLVHADCPRGTEDEMEMQGFDMGEALAIDLTFVVTEADAIVLLPGWMMSRGAVAELATAKAMGLPAYEFDDLTGTLDELEVGETHCRSCQGKSAEAPLSVRFWMLVRDAARRGMTRARLSAERKRVAR
jgi:hypothetical protein